MLKYFKRQKSQSSTENDKCVQQNANRLPLMSSSSFCDEVFEDHAEIYLQAKGDEDIFNYQSRLSMSLISIVKDSDCFICFIQYLETKNALPFIKFYLDTENFKVAAVEQLRKQKVISNAVTENSDVEKEDFCHNCIVDSCSENVIDVSTKNVPELKTLCDISMHKCLTDDEKSRIYDETNKQINKWGAPMIAKLKLQTRSQLSLCSKLSLDECSVGDASIKDAIAIYQKYLCPTAQCFVEIPVDILSDISLLLCKSEIETVVDDLLQIPATCFVEAQKFVLNELERLYLTDFLQSPFYCKYCLELICDRNGEKKLNIYDILYSEVAMFFFMEFLEQQGEREALDFWTAAIHFRKSYASSNENINQKEMEDDAMIIYKKFFSLQYDKRLWLSDRLRSHVETNICDPNQLGVCFDLALILTAKYFDEKYLSAFLKSDLFAQYVNELETKIQESLCAGDRIAFNSIDTIDTHTKSSTLQHKLSFKYIKKPISTPSTKRRHRKTLSDCTNDGQLLKHVSQQNTLLAADSTRTYSKHLKTPSSAMSIDGSQLTNPNLLWKRRNSVNETGSQSGSLTFGRVNCLGRYERDFETIDSVTSHSGGTNHWSLGVSSSKLANAMRKLVKLPEHKAQEEIAWQIAEMIVNEVTSVTLKNAPMKKDAD